MPLAVTQLGAGLMGISRSFSSKRLPMKVDVQTGDTGDNTLAGKEMEFSLLVILNTPFYANGFKLGKSGGLFDGLLDCCVIHTGSFTDTLRVGGKIQRGTDRNAVQKEVEFFQSPSFKIFSQRPIDIQGRRYHRGSGSV
jgi:hypothetical protein